MSRVSSLATGQEVVAQLVFEQSEVQVLKEKLLALTKAKVTVRVGRTAAGGIEYGERDDVGIQLAATVKALEFAVGKPKQMLVVDRTPGNPGQRGGKRELAQLLAEHPEIATRVIGALKDGIALSQAIDVTTTSATPAPRPSE